MAAKNGLEAAVLRRHHDKVLAWLSLEDHVLEFAYQHRMVTDKERLKLLDWKGENNEKVSSMCLH